MSGARSAKWPMWAKVVIFVPIALGLIAAEVTIFGLLVGARDWVLCWVLAGFDACVIFATAFALRRIRKTASSGGPTP
jgi:hypothetical protein